MLTGTNLVYTKKYNLRIVHEVIRVHGPLSRADVARHTQLSDAAQKLRNKIQSYGNQRRTFVALQDEVRSMRATGAPGSRIG